MNYDQWKDWWVSRAPEYFTDKIWQFSKPELIARLGIEKYDPVLEIGFGYGREISEFCRISNHVFGLELAEWSCQNTLKELAERGVAPLPRLKAYNGRIIPFPPQVFYVAYGCFVIQHLSRDHARDMIKEALRVTQAEGKVLFEFFGDPEYYAGGEDVFSGIDGEGGMFNNAYTADELPGLVSDCGGELHWIETCPVTQEWGNHWVCFGPGGKG